MNNRFLMLITAFVMVSANLFAQGERKDKTAVTYEEIYDEPYSINKLFVGLMPLYGELFATSVNAGFGLDVQYYHKDKFDIHAQFRKSYSATFFDQARNQATTQDQSSVDNRVQQFNYYELGATYHIKDFEESSKTKMFLYKNSYKGNKWSARVPLHAEVPCKVRKIYGLRFGGILWNSATDLDRALKAQEIAHKDLKNLTNPEDLDGMPTQEYNKSGTLQPVHLFTNVRSMGGYIGGSMSWFKNVAVDFDKFEEGVDNLMFTAYFDILVAPSITLDNISYTEKDNNGLPLSRSVYSVDAVKTKPIGFRLGMEGRFNRTFGWSYGGEIGYRPSIQSRGFYAALKLCFPVFGTNLDYKVESFGK